MEKRQNYRVNNGPKGSFNKPKKSFYPPKKEHSIDKSSFVFGVQSVLETLRSEKEIDKILIQREMGQAEIEQLARQREVPVQRVPAEKLNRITGKNHQGVIAFISSVNYAQLANVVAATFEAGETPLFLVLDRITDVRNFGAIARTAECLGVHGIVIPTRGAAQINADAMKTSSGALNYLPVCRENDLSLALEQLQQSGMQLVACTEKGEGTLSEIDFTQPTVVIMGSEEDGISESNLERCDTIVKIPMTGKVESLNVSVATGIILYEAIRQRLA